MQDELNLYDYWNVIQKRRKVVIFTTVSIFIFGILSSYLLTPMYKASVTIIPIGQQSSGGIAALLGSQLGLSGLLGGQGEGGSQHMALLKSRTLAERIVEKNDLFPKLFKKTPYPPLSAAAGALKSFMKFTEDAAAGTIEITAETDSPENAELFARLYSEELAVFIKENTFTKAKHFRLFIETQIAKNTKELLNAGKALSTFYKDGVSSVDSLVSVPIYKSEDITTTMAELNNKFTNIEDKKTIIDNQLEDMQVVEKVPQQLYLRYLTQQRGVIEEMSAVLTQQYEMAKLEEAKNDLVFQVVDTAIIPSSPSSPNIKLIRMLSLFGGLIVAVFIAFSLEWIEDQKRLATAN